MYKLRFILKKQIYSLLGAACNLLKAWVPCNNFKECIRTVPNMNLFNTAIFLLFLYASASPLDYTEPGSITGTTSHYAKVRGKTYHYLAAQPSNTTEPKGTIILFHGLPDFSYGWRYQVPFLSSLGYQVIVPDMLGYADTDSPCELSNWAMKQLSTDMDGLLEQIVPGEDVIVGGHDWGAGLAYKFAMWHPERVRSFFTVAIAYLPPWLGLSAEWVDLAVLIENGTFPTLGYQLQWRDVSFDRNFTTQEQIRQLLNAGFGGLTPEGLPGWSEKFGLLYDRLPRLGPNPLVTGAELDFYVEKIHQKGIRGGWNWYRVRRMDWEDELGIAQRGDFKFKMPALFIPATKDTSMLPRYYENMGQYFEELKIEKVDAGHWALWEAKERVNEILGNWIGDLETASKK